MALRVMMTSGPFPIGPFAVLCLIAGGANVLAFCFWFRLGPRSWYGEPANVTNSFIWNNAAAQMPAIAALFTGFAIAMICVYGRRSSDVALLKGISTLGALLGGAVAILGGLATFSIFFTNRPQMLVPPPFRREHPARR
jgi:hypothetical protein